MHGDAHYHDVGGKPNNEWSALLFRLLFRKMEYMRIFRVEHFMVFHFYPLLHGHFRVVSSGQTVTTQKESHVESSLRERDDCDVNKFSISLVCGLRAQAADTVMFCFCLWELF